MGEGEAVRGGRGSWGRERHLGKSHLGEAEAVRGGIVT